MPTPEQIRTSVVEILTATGPKLGSQLGAMVQAGFQNDPVNFKEQFGGLSNFLAAHCSDVVQVQERHGGDLLYGLKPAEGQAPQKASIPLPPQLEYGIWQCFVSPYIQAVLCVHRDTGELVVKPKGESCPEPFLQVPKLLVDDHKKAIAAFIERDMQQQRVPPGLLARTHYWQAWLNLLRVSPPPLRGAWVEYRNKWIMDEFRKRLLEAGLSDEAVVQAERSLVQAQRMKAKMPVRFAGRGSTIRAVVLQAIESLSDEQLRGLWLPVGSILDAVQRKPL